MAPHPHVFHVDRRQVVAAPLRLSLIAVPSLLGHVHRVCEQPGNQLVVDLTGTLQVDRDVVWSLAWAARHTRHRGSRLVLVPPPPGVLDAVALAALSILWWDWEQ